MNKKIKIIDLLNKIANGEEVPDKIKYNSIIYNWDIKGYLHYEDEHYSERAFLEGYRTDMVLNDYVEILEDNTEEIEELPKMNFFELVTDEVKTAMAMEKIKLKVDELVKAINKIRKDLNK